MDDTYIPVKPNLGGVSSKHNQSTGLFTNVKDSADPDIATALKSKKRKDITDLEHAKTKEETESKQQAGYGINWVVVSLVVIIVLLIIIIVYFLFKYNNGLSIPANIIKPGIIAGGGGANIQQTPDQPVEMPNDYKPPSKDELQQALQDMSRVEGSEKEPAEELTVDEPADVVLMCDHEEDVEDLDNNDIGISIEDLQTDSETEGAEEFLRYQEELKQFEDLDSE